LTFDCSPVWVLWLRTNTDDTTMNNGTSRWRAAFNSCSGVWLITGVCSKCVTSMKVHILFTIERLSRTLLYRQAVRMLMRSRSDYQNLCPWILSSGSCSLLVISWPILERSMSASILAYSAGQAEEFPSACQPQSAKGASSASNGV
jgi:hypothetical protein